MLAVVSRGEVAVFLVTAVMMGYGMGTIDSFMFIYLSELGTHPTCVSLVCTLSLQIQHNAVFALRDHLEPY